MHPQGEPTPQEELNSDAMVVDAGARSSEGASVGPEGGMVAVPVHTPVAGTRRAAEDGERSVRRLTLMRNAQAFDLAFSAAVIAVGLVPGAILCAAIAIDSPGCPLYGQRRVGRIARRSVAMDLKIILQTVAVVFTGKGAA